MGPQGSDAPSDGRLEGTPKVRMKRKLDSMELYSGRRPGECGPAFDLRASIATEYAVDGFEPGPNHIFQVKREKMRKTYHFRAWKIDVSLVRTEYPKPPEGANEPPKRPETTHEVEIELDSYPLMRNLEAKAEGGKHMLWELLTDFLDTARDLAVLAGEITPLAVPPCLSQTRPSTKSEDESAFKQRHGASTPLPVIGHYLSRIARAATPASAAAVVGEAVLTAGT